MSNLYRPTLLVIRHINVIAHAESLSKILNFELEDECNSIPVIAFERISSRKRRKPNLKQRHFLLANRMIYLSEN